MRCSRCGFANPEGMKFCGACGVALQYRCPNCTFANPPLSRFCGECGAPLTVQAPTSQAVDASFQTPPLFQSRVSDPIFRTPESERGVLEGERRQLTVMFCDLVGSTPLAEKLDPEELREVVQRYHKLCDNIVRRFGGYIVRSMGDGLLIYFGYPQAHEDDAQRAVQAGLRIVDGMRPLKARLRHPVLQALPLQVHIGIHTGLVVVGGIGGGEFRDPMAIVGETPNVAARLQEVAGPDTLVISATTYRLVEGLFKFRDLGLQTLKGVSTPVHAYQALAVSDVQSRFEATLTKGLTPLVGREQELRLLLERWGVAKEGLGQVVLLGGEPGIGKSRLLQVLKEHVAGEEHTRLECRCLPYYRNSALFPVIDLMQRVLQFRREDSPQEKLSKLEEGMARHPFSLQEAVPLLASLLSLPLPARYPPLSLTPQQQRQRTLEVLLAVLLSTAQERPVLFIVEDLHWVDPSTLELLSFFIVQTQTARILSLFTFRPEFSSPWGTRSHLSWLTLSRLAHKQVEEMVERVAGGKVVPAAVMRQLVTKTDGVPLFVEELTKTVLESGLLKEESDRYVMTQHTAPLPLAIPATLQDSLMARLDRLGTAKEIAQLGATLGREFSYELLRAVSSLDEAMLQRELARLGKAELLYPRGLLPHARYIFKHALIQEAAYQSLLRSKRQQYHKQIAQVLRERFLEICEAQPELLAHHYTEAGLVEQALPFWQKAGQRAVERSANREAISHLTKGLDLLKTLPDTPELVQQELLLQTTLGPALIATKGYAAAEVEQTYARAKALCQQVGKIPELFPTLWGLWVFYLVRAKLQVAQELGEQCLHLSQSVQDRALLLQAHHAMGVSWSALGNFVLAREHLEQEGALYDPQQHRSLAFRYGQDPGVACLSHTAWTLWFLGYADQALTRIKEALLLARELSHPNSLAAALNFAAYVHQLRREGPATREWAEALITLCTEREIPFWLAWGTILQGWALAEQGQAEEGIAQTRQGLTAYWATGAELQRPYFLALLADAYRKAGQIKEGLSVLTGAMSTVKENKERWWEAELYRLKGELSLGAGGWRLEAHSFSPQASSLKSPAAREMEREAEECFHKAIDIACRQSAKLLELRATMSLSRLWQQQGKAREARRLMTKTYEWFTEGFDTPDLKDAKVLLEQMS